MACSVVDPSTREYRFEEGYDYDKQTKQTHHVSNPTKWSKIGRGSPVERVVDYIIANHPRFKKEAL